MKWSRKENLIAAALLVLCAASPARAEDSYTVRPGDSLGALSKKFFPEQKIWGENGSFATLYRLNQGEINNPNLIHPGQVILVPLTGNLARVPKKPRVPGRVLATIENGAVEKIGDEREALPTPAVDARKAAEESLAAAEFSIGAKSSLRSRSLQDRTTGSSGKMHSNPTIGVSALALIPVSAESGISLGIDYERITYTPGATRGIVAQNRSFLLYRLGLMRRLGAFSYTVGAQYEQLPLVVGVSTSSVGVAAFNVASPYCELKWNFHEWGHSSFALAGKFLYRLESKLDTYKLEKGWGGEIYLPIRRKVGEKSFSLVPSVGYAVHETNTVKHSDSQAGLSFYWHF